MPGLNWRFLARDWRNPYRQVYHLTGDDWTWFDELAAGDWLHIEWLNGRHRWMRVGDAMINVTIPKDKPAIVKIIRDSHYHRPTRAEADKALEEGDVESDPYRKGDDEE